jgi:DNA-binding CsgD family transcriptional regulator
MSKLPHDTREVSRRAAGEEGSHDYPHCLLKLEELARSRDLTIDQIVEEFIEKESSRQMLQESQTAALSPKQKLVLEHLRAGLSTKEIADALSVGEETVRTHILRIRARIDCPDLLSLRFR